MVTNVTLAKPADAREPGHAYLVNFGLRLFRPTAWISLACPLTEKLWHFDTMALDFRASQNEFAMIPREGPWWSDSEVTLVGTVDLTSPLQGGTLGLPEQLFVTMRVSWSPAHCVVRFEENDILQKISFRPWQGTTAYWRRGTFDTNVFSREQRLSTPLMFFTPSEIPPGAAHTDFAAEATPKASDDDDDWGTCKSWGDNEWHNDWHDNGWHSNWADERDSPKHESRANSPRVDSPSTQADQSQGPFPAPSDPSTAKDESEEPPIHLEPMPTIDPPSPVEIPPMKEVNVSVSPAPERTDAPMPKIVLVPYEAPADSPQSPVTSPTDPYATTPAPSNFPASMSRTSRESVSELSPSQYELDFQALQCMANMGPPRTLGQRYQRQVIANRLGLSPLIYNMMVFGEVPPSSPAL